MNRLEATLVVSALAIAGLFVLFAIEERRGVRFAEGVRRWLDDMVDRVSIWWHTTMLYIGSGAVRVGIHLLIHRLLRSVSAYLRLVQALLERWVRRNREIARSVQAARTESHLSAIAEHKHIHALSEEEKQALKDRSLSG